MLIEQALARNEIDEETALIYKVFAEFGDLRLPESYRGDDSQVEDSNTLQEVVERFDNLSTQAHTTLQPFLLRPPTPGSWLEPTAVGLSQSTAAAIPQVAWGTVDTVSGKIKVWYQHRYVSDESKADDIALALDAIIWPDLIDDLEMKAPLSDLSYPDSGGDGRLDIYLVHIVNRGVTHPIDGCEQTPAYILINSDRPIGDATHEGIVQTMVHELMHASQFAYPVQKACSEYDWLAEATSKWAEDYVYPLANSEQPYLPPFLQSIDLPLEDASDIRRPYGAYLWPFYLTHPDANGLIPAIWSETVDGDSLEAIDRSIPGGFEQQWAEFTLLNWNRPPVTDYQTWDNLTRHVEGSAVRTIDVTLQGVGDKRQALELLGGVEHLAAEYFHLKFVDNEARTVAFYNGYTYKVAEQDVDLLRGLESGSLFGVQYTSEALSPEERKGAHVKALVKITGKDWRVEDWTEKPIAIFCRDKADERVEELVLIFSNSLFEPRDESSVRKPKGLAPTLWVSDIGCWQWEGTAQWDFHDIGPYWDATYTHSALVTWKLPSRTTMAMSPMINHSGGVYHAGFARFEAEGSVTKAVSGKVSPSCFAAPQQATVPILLNYGNNELLVNGFTTAGPLYRAYRGKIGAFVTEGAQFFHSCGYHTDYHQGTEFTPPEAPPFAVIPRGGNLIEDEFGTHGRDDFGTSRWQFTSLSER
ncbi:MAG: hypothetical protein J5I90_17800 [Caldilineales bacterium]|nr:hypothetical protein [Caldilineales bacterium]